MISHVPITKRTEKQLKKKPLKHYLCIIKVGRSFVEEKKHMVWLITEHMVHTQACLSRTAYAASQLHYHWPPPTKIVLALSSFCLWWQPIVQKLFARRNKEYVAQNRATKIFVAQEAFAWRQQIFVARRRRENAGWGRFGAKILRDEDFLAGRGDLTPRGRGIDVNTTRVYIRIKLF